MKRFIVMALMYAVLAALSGLCLYFGAELLAVSRRLGVIVIAAGGGILLQSTLVYYRAARGVEP
jgi:hypothetical protein